MAKELNDTVAKFTYKGKKYEIDYLTDADREKGIKTYHLYGMPENPKLQGDGGYYLHEFESKKHDYISLVRLAKKEIEYYQIRF